MIEVHYDGSLEGLFGILGRVCAGAPVPDRLHLAREAGDQGDLFGEPGHTRPERGKTDCAAGAQAAEELFQLSVNGYTHFVHGWMSELPIETELIRFAARIISEARKAGRRPGLPLSETARLAADWALSDRGDETVRVVLAAAYKVAREIDRMRGLLRFSPNVRGLYIARCAPDYGILPALAGHFSRRFGETPWLIIDEKRALRLFRAPGQEPQLCADPADQNVARDQIDREGPSDPWEDLWRIYHHTISIESRTNPRLQRQWMPSRYWKYLIELG